MTIMGQSQCTSRPPSVYIVQSCKRLVDLHPKVREQSLQIDSVGIQVPLDITVVRKQNTMSARGR